MPKENVLYIAILPIIHLSTNFGLTDQIMTLFPDKKFATEFAANEVDNFIQIFKRRADDYLTGGHVNGYDFHKELTPDGRVIIKVVQRVG